MAQDDTEYHQLMAAIGEFYDKLTVDVMRLVCDESSNFVDIGASDGRIVRQMLNMALAGRHIALEPIPQWAAQLRSEFPSVEVWEAAAAETTGFDSFAHVVTNPFYSGLRRRPYDRPDEVVEEIRVSTVRLDETVPPERAIAFMKIDAEGGEVRVLRGARDLVDESGDVLPADVGTTHDALDGCLQQPLAGLVAAEHHPLVQAQTPRPSAGCGPGVPQSSARTRYVRCCAYAVISDSSSSSRTFASPGNSGVPPPRIRGATWMVSTSTRPARRNS